MIMIKQEFDAHGKEVPLPPGIYDLVGKLVKDFTFIIDYCF